MTAFAKLPNSIKTLLIILLISVLYVVVTAGITYYIYQKATPDLVWTMVNVNKRDDQRNGDAHLIQIKNGKTVLIDAGFLPVAEENLIPFLKQNKIKKIDLAFMTHAHDNHYGGLTAVLDAGVKIDEVYFRLPQKAVCDSEIPWGCKYDQVVQYHQKVSGYPVKMKDAEVGQVFDLGSGATLKLLYEYDGINTPVGQTDVNDTSQIMMLEHGEHKYLFTGDLNLAIGGYLAKNATDIQADVLKVPHHGTEGLAPNEFFEKVGAKYALIPAPAALWCNPRSQRPRQWFSEHNTPVYVNGFSGHVRVEERNGKIKINEEKKTVTPLC